MKSLISIAVFFAVISLGLYPAKSEEWDFTGERAPSFFDAKLNDTYHLKLSCREHMDLAYQAYSQKFPDYKTQSDEPGMRAKWRFAMMQHHLEIGRDWNSHCAYEVMRNEISDFGNFERGLKRRVFCGVFGQDLTDEEERIASRMEELLALSQAGSLRSMVAMLGASDYIPQLELLPSIRFYFQELMRVRADGIFDHIQSGKPLFIEDDKTGVSKADMEIIREAAIREDISVVINERTTCAKLDL